jgi:cation diffusion facilitator family transporter
MMFHGAFFMEDPLQTDRYKFLIASLSVVSNLLLVILKLMVGFTIGSISVISEALHSGVDVFAAVVATIGVKRSSEPADRDHRFGHGKFESFSGLVQAFLIFLAAFWIVYEAVRRLAHPAPMGELGWGVAVMLVSSLVNTAIGLVLLGAARKTDSLALKADAWHSLTDVITSAGVLVGLAAVWTGKRLFPGVDLAWIDPVAAVAVAVLIFKAAWDLTLESARDLLDVSLPQQEEDEIRNLLAHTYPDLVDCHKFRGRKSGSKRFVEFHIRVDPKMSVEASHSLHHSIAAEIKRRFPDAEVMVHMEPKKN